MPQVSVPTEFEAQILRENGLDPINYGVTHREADAIRLLCYATRDQLTIYRGDRKW